MPVYLQYNQHPNIEILTNARVVDVEGEAGDFTVSLCQKPRYVDPLRCINCGLGGDRLDMFFMSGSQAQAYANAARTMTERIKTFGPNPLKAENGRPAPSKVEGMKAEKVLPKEEEEEEVEFRGRRKKKR